MMAMKCTGCGCTDLTACVDELDVPCHWVEPDLCSMCAPKTSVREDNWFCGDRSCTFCLEEGRVPSFGAFALKCARDCAKRWYRHVWVKGFIWRRQIGFSLGFNLKELILDVAWWTRTEVRTFARRIRTGRYW